MRASCTLASTGASALHTPRLLVDKTGAIADLLSFMYHHSRVYFARPRGFGKATTLDTAGQMLAAGALPPGVKPWPGYRAVCAQAQFGGQQVHRRLLAGDATLGTLLQRPHFVVRLRLGSAQSGSQLHSAIRGGIAEAAAEAFGRRVQSSVRQMSTPSGALGALADAVPSAVPLALLVDGYDAAITQDVARGHWDAAHAGVLAMYSLAMATKCLNTGSRIGICLFAGQARLAGAHANNFLDLTAHPLLSRVLGLSEAEVRGTYPAQLQSLAASQGRSQDSAVQHLQHWHGGHCFDGASSSMSPAPVLAALRTAGSSPAVAGEGSSHFWLGLPPQQLLAELAGTGLGESSVGAAAADTQAEEVEALPLLLQTGLLSLHPLSQPSSSVARGCGEQEWLGSATDPIGPPNQAAREALLRAVAAMAGMSWEALQQCSQRLAAGLQARCQASCQSALHQALSAAAAAAPLHSSPEQGEDACHTLLHSLLLGSLPLQLGSVHCQWACVRGGPADLLVRLQGSPGSPGSSPTGSAVWILEVGRGATEEELLARAEQGKACAQSYAAEEQAVVCAVGVDRAGGGARFQWCQRAAGSSVWEQGKA